jgi:hypothetical protein
MVAPTSSGRVPSAFWEMLNWGAVDRILWMGVLSSDTYHAGPPPYQEHAVLKATSHGHGMGTAWYVWISIGRPETARGRPARVRLLLATTQSSRKLVIRSIPISDAGGQCETKQRLSWTRRTFSVGEWQGIGRAVAGSRHGMCESALICTHGKAWWFLH